MPGSLAAKLGRMIRDDNSIESVLVQNSHNTQIVQIAFVDMRFLVVGDLTMHVSEVDVGDAALAAVLVYCLINIAVSHLSQRADAEFQGVRWAVIQVNQFLIKPRLIHQTSLLPYNRKRRIVRMSRQFDSG